MTAVKGGPWQVREYRQHPKAAPTFLLYDASSHTPGQVATFLSVEEAQSIALVLNREDAAYRETLRAIDPYRDSF